MCTSSHEWAPSHRQAVNLCLNCVSVLTGGVTANGFKWRIQGDGEAKLCACHLSVRRPYHCFCPLTPSTVILWLCFDIYMCMVCLCVRTPTYTCTVATWLLDGWVSGYHELWTLKQLVLSVSLSVSQSSEKFWNLNLDRVKRFPKLTVALTL